MDSPVDEQIAAEPVWVRWVLLALRLTQIVLCAWILVLLPLPILADWLPLKNVIVVMSAVVLGGKSLYDTLFFDRYWP
jgi:hypothetical protein